MARRCWHVEDGEPYDPLCLDCQTARAERAEKALRVVVNTYEAGTYGDMVTAIQKARTVLEGPSRGT